MSLRTAFLRAWLVAAIYAVISRNAALAFAESAESGCHIPKSTLETYVVKRGETLSGILLQAGFRRLWCSTCAVSETAKQNQVDDPNLLQIGQILNLPHSVKVADGCGPSRTRQAASVAEVTPAIEQASPPKKTTPVAPIVEEHRPFQSELFFGVPLHAIEVGGTDRTDRSTGRLLTGISPGAVLAWRLRTNNGWGAEISSRYEFDAIQLDVNSVSIDGREQKIGSLEAHVSYGTGVRFGFDFKARDRMIYRAASGPGIRVQTLPTRNLGSTISVPLFRFYELGLTASASYETLLADENLSAGSAYSGRLILRQDFDHWALESEAGYESSRYQTTLLEVNSSDLWLTWGISWKL